VESVEIFPEQEFFKGFFEDDGDVSKIDVRVSDKVFVSDEIGCDESGIMDCDELT
jgi:hypothetical protein